MTPFRLSTRLQPAPRPVRAPAALSRGAERGAESGAGGTAAAVESPESTASAGEVGAQAGAARDAGPVPAPVPVPWRVVHRAASGVIELEHVGVSAVHAVSFAMAGSGMLGLSLPRTVLPRERLRVVLRGARAESAAGAPDAALVVRWVEPDGRELLWPMVLP